MAMCLFVRLLLSLKGVLFKHQDETLSSSRSSPCTLPSLSQCPEKYLPIGKLPGGVEEVVVVVGGGGCFLPSTWEVATVGDKLCHRLAQQWHT